VRKYLTVLGISIALLALWAIIIMAQNLDASELAVWSKYGP
jgi:hypothetical protein